jgi:hypothetical protein
MLANPLLVVVYLAILAAVQFILARHVQIIVGWTEFSLLLVGCYLDNGMMALPLSVFAIGILGSLDLCLSWVTFAGWKYQVFLPLDAHVAMLLVYICILASSLARGFSTGLPLLTGAVVIRVCRAVFITRTDNRSNIIKFTV